ncbi:cytochrome P450 71A9-like [Macadamia integrifolia]|uniref:cytochrome P450 71A9-like n=1 Tax=Macadamia integrifolia TaxID=60698 RepID=UPI001C4E716E|nr:cytochrome P450 71A9-like [Macadamia integrifolia]
MAFFIFLFLLFLFIFTRKMNGEKKGANLPPGPPKLPIIGNLHQLGYMPHRSFWQLAKQYGPLMHLQLGFAPTLIVSSAKMAEEILKIHDLEFCSRPSLVGPKKLSYNFKDIAFSPYTEYWREMRKTCVLELFSSKRVQTLKFIREDEVSLMIHSISTSSSSSPTEGSINLNEVMLSLVNNIICRIAFGQRHQEVCQRSRFQDILQEAQALLGGFYVEDYFPSLGWVIDILSGQHGKLEKNFKELDEFYEQIISDHLNPGRPESDHEDIVDVLLRIEKEQSGSIHFTKEHIKAVIMDIFIAGTDTATAALVWGMAELIKKPTVMKKAQDEVRSLIGTKGKVEESDLDQLGYVKSVVKEILRMHPPGPLLAPRETRFHCKIDGYDVYPKTRVIVSPWAIGRDPEAWENPDEFFPERFLGSSINFIGLHFQLVPLGAGRRGCPGIYLGPVIVQLALANLLYAFDWELPSGISMEDIDMEEAPGLTTHKKSSLCLVPKLPKSNI